MKRATHWSRLLVVLLLAAGGLLACSRGQDNQAHAKRIKAELVYYAIPG